MKSELIVPLSVSCSWNSFPRFCGPPSIEDLQMYFDPHRTQVWTEDMKNIPIGWLQSPHRLLARIMLQNLWPLSRNSNLTIRRAKFLYAIIQRVSFYLCKHIVTSMIEMQEESRMGLPYGCLVTSIVQRFVSNIPAYEPEATPKGAFGKHTVMKSNA